MANSKRLVLLACAFLMHLMVTAQNATETVAAKSEGFMRSEAKINVVMAVVIIILAGLLLYVVRLDRKITKLEKGNF